MRRRGAVGGELIFYNLKLTHHSGRKMEQNERAAAARTTSDHFAELE